MIRNKALLSVAAVAALATAPALADNHSTESKLPGVVDTSRVTAGTYSADAAHTLVGWRVNHFGFNDYFGSFGSAEGTLAIDPAIPSAAAVEIAIPISSVAVVSEGLRDHLLRAGKDGADPDFFGPEPGMAIFRSTSVVLGDDGTSATITGNLTMLGASNEVTIDAEFTGAGKNPMNQAETIGFEGTATIMRSDYGLDYALPLVGDEVELEISAAFEKQ